MAWVAISTHLVVGIRVVGPTVDGNELLEVALGKALGAQEEHVLKEVSEACQLRWVGQGADADRESCRALADLGVICEKHTHAITQ